MRASLLVLALAAGCGPFSSPRPHLVAEPEVLYLAGAREGDAKTVSLKLRNSGAAPLAILRATIASKASLQLRCPSLPRTVPPGEEVTLAVEHQGAPGGGITSVLEVESDDLARPLIRVSILGLSSVPVITVSATALHFGPTPGGVTDLRELQVKNVGLARARALHASWAVPSPDFSAALSVDELAAGEAAVLTTAYSPRGGNRDEAVLRIRWEGGSTLVPVDGWQDLTPPD